MRTSFNVLLLGAAVMASLVFLVACEDDTTINLAPHDAGAEAADGAADEGAHDAAADAAEDAAERPDAR